MGNEGLGEIIYNNSNNMERNNSIDKIQSDSYYFPYHYLLDPDGFPNLSKRWAYSPSYIAAVRLFRRWLKDLSRGKGWRHIDFGCGDGGFIHAVSASGLFGDVDFYGIDRDPQAVEWARKLANSRVCFECGDLKDLPQAAFSSGSLIEVLEHIPPNECDDFVAGIARSLKNDGELFVTVPSTERPTSAKHYRHFTFNSLQAEFDDKFECINIAGFDKRSIFSWLARNLSVNKIWHFESRLTNRIITAMLERPSSRIDKCSRILAVFKKRSDRDGVSAC